MRKFLQIILIFLFFSMYSQNSIREVDDLTKDNSGWDLVNEWVGSAKNKVILLPVFKSQAKENISKIQVTTKSPMGAIIYNSGGVVIEDGWIRIIGSGSDKMNRQFYNWNLDAGIFRKENSFSSLFIADDIVGGYFVLNGGALGNDLGKIYYFSPDSLE